MRIEKRFEAFPDDVLSLQMIENVSNAADLKAKIVSKLLSVEAAFLDADLIPDIFLVHLAAFKALSAQVGFSSILKRIHMHSITYLRFV
jgi:hypothetical protein